MLSTRAPMLTASSGAVVPQLAMATARLSHMPLRTFGASAQAHPSTASHTQTRQLSLEHRPQIKATPLHAGKPILLSQPLSKRQFSATAKAQLKMKKYFPEPENNSLIRTTKPAWEHPG